MRANNEHGFAYIRLLLEKIGLLPTFFSNKITVILIIFHYFCNMIIPRDKYLQELRSVMHNGMIKIITGVRRLWKNLIFYLNYSNNHYLENGVNEEHIIQVDLEDRRNKHLREPDRLLDHIDGHITDNDMYYILLDEIQPCS